MTGRAVQIAARARHFADCVSGLMFAAIFAVSVAGIAMRYVFHAPLLWGTEVQMLLLMWCTFLTDAFVIRSGDHVAFDVVWEMVSPPVRRLIGIVGRLAFALVFLVAFPSLLDYVLFLWRERTDVLELRLDAVYSCFLIYMAAIIVRLGAELAAFLGGHWRHHVETSGPMNGIE